MPGQKLGLAHFGTHTLNALRMEKGFKLWGSEMNLDVDALEADLGSFIRWKKVGKRILVLKTRLPCAGFFLYVRHQADFLGKDGLVERRHKWRHQRLVMMAVQDGHADPHGNESVWMEDKVEELYSLFPVQRFDSSFSYALRLLATRPQALTAPC